MALSESELIRAIKEKERNNRGYLAMNEPYHQTPENSRYVLNIHAPQNQKFIRLNNLSFSSNLNPCLTTSTLWKLSISGEILVEGSTYSGSKDSLGTSPDIGSNMTNKILWFLILGLMVFQSGCALEKYHQGSEDYSRLRYSQDEARFGPQSGPSPG